MLDGEEEDLFKHSVKEKKALFEPLKQETLLVDGEKEGRVG